MQTVTGLYDNYSDAKTVVRALETAGIPSSEISIIGRNSETNTSYAGEGAATVPDWARLSEEPAVRSQA
jgi:hypothetical protein